MMKKVGKIFMAIACLCLCAMPLAGCGQNNTPAGSVTLSVNPEVQLIVDGNNKVVSVNYSNKDAEILLADINIVGKNIDMATKIFVEQCTLSGYFKLDATTAGENKISINVSGKSDDFAKKLEGKVKESANGVFNDLKIKGETVKKDLEALANQAKKYNITKEKMSLVLQAAALSPEKTLEELSKMTEAELAGLIKTKCDQFKGLALECKNQVVNEVKSVKAVVLQLIQTTKSSIEQIKNEIATNLTEAQKKLLNDLEAKLNAAIKEIEDFINLEIQNLQANSEQLKLEAKATLKANVTKNKQTLIAHLDALGKANQLAGNKIADWKNKIESYN
ncbi:MAG: hypothetical protein RR400_00250 [Clostridia bacterium]